MENILPDYDWNDIAAQLDVRGWARLPTLLKLGQCDALAALYPEDSAFRSTVVMARHGFGSGEYRYFSEPLPPLVNAMRTALYRRLAPIANAWQNALGLSDRFPDDLAAFLARCHTSGQKRPTPLLLRYGPGDYNCLHRDIYGEIFFPLQVVVMLSNPECDFSGGDFALTEQRPRMQSRVEVVSMRKGDGVIFPGHIRPKQGQRGVYRVAMRHGVSTIETGRRQTLGLIFHDAT